jgi:outer membrane protein assembly factor BamB
MFRHRVAGIVSGLLLLAGAVSAVADAPDPEPPNSRAGSSATSGDLTVKVDNIGNIAASNKRGQVVWATSLFKGRRLRGEGQVLIQGDRVVVAKGGTTNVLDLRTGKLFWQRFGDLRDGKLSIKGDRVILKEKGKRDVLDLKTGRFIEGGPN